MKPLHYIGLALLLLLGGYSLRVTHFRFTTVPLSAVTRTLPAIPTQTVCEVHQVELQKDVVPISYGLMPAQDFSITTPTGRCFLILSRGSMAAV
jgi:hypothetical protein